MVSGLVAKDSCARLVMSSIPAMNQVGISNNPVGLANGKETGIVEVGKYLAPDLFVTYAGRRSESEWG